MEAGCGDRLLAAIQVFGAGETLKFRFPIALTDAVLGAKRVFGEEGDSGSSGLKIWSKSSIGRTPVSSGIHCGDAIPQRQTETMLEASTFSLSAAARGNIISDVVRKPCALPLRTPDQIACTQTTGPSFFDACQACLMQRRCTGPLDIFRRY